MRPDTDPAIQVALQDRRLFIRHYSRPPHSESELQEFMDRLRKQSLEIAKRDKERQKSIEDERQRILAEKEAQRIHRLTMRYAAVLRKSPVDSVDALKVELQEGGANFENIRVQIRENDPSKYLSLTNADASFVNMRNGVFSGVRFEAGANFSHVDFSGSTFIDVVFERGSSVEGADFSEAKFFNTKFEGSAVVNGADFRKAEFDSACSIEFDSNFIAQAKFGMRPNTWQSLSRSYTGVVQFLNLAFGFFYFGILVMKILLLHSLAPLQSEQGNHETSAVIYIALGGGSFDWRALSLSLSILIYQALRLKFTMALSPLIEEQRYGGRTPSKDEYRSRALWQPYLNFFGYVVFSMFLYDIYIASLVQVCFPIWECIQ